MKKYFKTLKISKQIEYNLRPNQISTSGEAVSVRYNAWGMFLFPFVTQNLQFYLFRKYGEMEWVNHYFAYLYRLLTFR